MCERTDHVGSTATQPIQARRESSGTIGAVLGLVGALYSAGSTIQTRAMTKSGTTSSIVFYFSLICTIAGSPPGRSAGSRRAGASSPPSSAGKTG